MEAERKDKYRGYYTSGTAARKLQPMPDYEREQEQRSRVLPQPTRAPRINRGIDLFSMSLLVIALAITMVLCYNYLQVQGNIVELERDVANAEKELAAVQANNNALEEGLKAETNWDKVYQVAVSELGMVYPNKNEVISYSGQDEGYVIQYRDIPE